MRVSHEPEKVSVFGGLTNSSVHCCGYSLQSGRAAEIFETLIKAQGGGLWKSRIRFLYSVI